MEINVSASLCNTRWRRKEKRGEEMDEEGHPQEREKIKGVLTCWTE